MKTCTYCGDDAHEDTRDGLLCEDCEASMKGLDEEQERYGAFHVRGPVLSPRKVRGYW